MAAGRRHPISRHPVSCPRDLRWPPTRRDPAVCAVRGCRVSVSSGCGGGVENPPVRWGCADGIGCVTIAYRPGYKTCIIPPEDGVPSLRIRFLRSQELTMPVLIPESSKRTRPPARRVSAKTSSKPAPTASVRLERPSGASAALQRGQELAMAIREELAALSDGSLDQTMTHLRGRAWS